MDSRDIKINEKMDWNIKGKKLCYIKEIANRENYKDETDETLEAFFDNFEETVEKYREMGAEVNEVSVDISLLKALFPVYITISCAEATSNNSNLTGIIFVPRGDGKCID